MKIEERRKISRDFKYRIYRKKVNVRNFLIKGTDAIFTAIGMVILIALLIITLPLLILDHWLSGER